MVSITSKTVERVTLRRGTSGPLQVKPGGNPTLKFGPGSTATVQVKTRGTGLRVIQGGNLVPTEPQVTDLLAQYILLSN